MEINAAGNISIIIWSLKILLVLIIAGCFFIPNVANIFWREYKSYFTSWIGYITLCGFFLFTSFFIFLMWKGIIFYGDKPFALVNITGFVIGAIFFGPIMTMRAFSDEKKNGTIELLFTSPVKTYQLVIGKFLASFGLFMTFLFLSLIYVLYIFIFEQEPGADYLMIFSEYMGIVYLGVGILALGLFLSSITKEPFVAALLGIIIGFFLLFLSQYASSESQGSFMQIILSELSLISHVQDMFQGIVKVKDIAFFLLWTTLFLSLTNTALESHKWK